MDLKKIIKSIVIENADLNITDEFRHALDLIENTNENIFITGKAGSGKSTFINIIRKNTKKKIAVLSPTGLSAINVKGQTIHSFFHFPPRLLTEEVIHNFKGNTRVFKAIDMIIIDEVSMVRADMLDTIDWFLRKHGRDEFQPFGGCQMVLVGDLFQLPPVVNSSEKEIIYARYETPYFFSSSVFKLNKFRIIEFSQIFRQTDVEFIRFLNLVRTGEVNSEDMRKLNKNVTDKLNDNYITLTTTNSIANAINEKHLNEMDSKLFVFPAIIEGNFPTEGKSLPIDLDLKLKKGARVMFVRNDKSKRWLNGTLGTVKDLEEGMIKVKIDKSDGGKVVEVKKEEWENIKYSYDPISHMVEENVLGKLIQYPLRLAWAVTIHKSQGMTFDQINLDFSRSPFAHGQTYVALSRSRSLNGISLTQEIWPNDVIVDEQILNFLKK
jgi:ATP-dependent exoDNAse (exonuclease V) alpha subunit